MISCLCQGPRSFFRGARTYRSPQLQLGTDSCNVSVRHELGPCACLRIILEGLIPGMVKCSDIGHTRVIQDDFDICDVRKCRVVPLQNSAVTPGLGRDQDASVVAVQWLARQDLARRRRLCGSVRLVRMLEGSTPRSCWVT